MDVKLTIRNLGTMADIRGEYETIDEILTVAREYWPFPWPIVAKIGRRIYEHGDIVQLGIWHNSVIEIVPSPWDD